MRPWELVWGNSGEALKTSASLFNSHYHKTSNTFCNSGDAQKGIKRLHASIGVWTEKTLILAFLYHLNDNKNKLQNKQNNDLLDKGVTFCIFWGQSSIICKIIPHKNVKRMGYWTIWARAAHYLRQSSNKVIQVMGYKVWIAM